MHTLPGDTGGDGGSGAGEGMGGRESSARVLRALEEMMSRHFPIENSREPVEGSKEAAAFAMLLRGLLGAFVRYDSWEGQEFPRSWGDGNFPRARAVKASRVLYTWFHYIPNSKAIIAVLCSTQPFCSPGREMLLRLFYNTLHFLFFHHRSIFVFFK